MTVYELDPAHCRLHIDLARLGGEHALVALLATVPGIVIRDRR